MDSLKGVFNLGKMTKGGGVWGVPKSLEHFLQDFYHFRLSESAWMKQIFQMSATFLEATNIRIYAVLSDFAKCRDSRVKSAPQLPKIEGGVQPIRAMPVFRPLKKKRASLIYWIKDGEEILLNILLL